MTPPPQIYPFKFLIQVYWDWYAYIEDEDEIAAALAAAELVPMSSPFSSSMPRRRNKLERLFLSSLLSLLRLF